MPIYEYRCEQGHTFEVMQRISDDQVASCQTCSAPVRRVFHPVAVHFKGSGFYSTDYGSRKRAKEQGDAAEATGKDDGKSKSEAASKDGDGAKSDSKPSADSSSKPSTSTKTASGSD
jgi:putative FmdB family regulatory protein